MCHVLDLHRPGVHPPPRSPHISTLIGVFDDSHRRGNLAIPLCRVMGTCELCGSDTNSTRQAIASNVNVDACLRCIESMGLELFESPFRSSDSQKSKKLQKQSRIIHSQHTPTESKTLLGDFHVRIRDERVSRGWQQKDLAMRMNERLNTIQKIENGSRPTDELVTKLEKILGISLLGESNIEYDAQLSRRGDRGLTIADALEDYLSKGDSDD